VRLAFIINDKTIPSKRSILDFRLTRIILIDSYCASRIAELDVSGHITINGENGAGKTTLLRLLPIFFGESPSRIIRGDAVTERFGRYYFPTTSSYVIFEYQRRNHKALAVIHPDGQSGDGVVYRFIESEYKPELFKNGSQIVQARDLYRHLDKQGVYDSKPLTLHSYRQIIQNTAGREHRNLAARFSFTGGTGKLTHLERVVTGILQRATTFFDLKRMIVSSVLNGDETFALRTGKKDLQHWINEYEAHRNLMEKAPLMADLEQSDHYRRMAEAEFSRLHARFKLLHDQFQEQVSLAEAAEANAKKDMLETEATYRNRLQMVSDKKIDAEARANQAKKIVERLDSLKRQYEADGISAKVTKVDSLNGWLQELEPLQKQLNDLEREVKSVTEVFDAMETEAKNLAKDQKAELDAAVIDIYQASSKRRDQLAESHKANVAAIRQRHEPEREAADINVRKLQKEEAGLSVEARNAQADPEALKALEIERQRQIDANADLSNLHDKTESFQKAHNKIKRDFDELELQINSGEVTIEKTQEELEELLAADNASEDTFLAFLRRNKPNWAADIGRVVSTETLLRSDLSPVIAGGTDLYGVAIDLENLKASRFSSEEAIQQEMKLVRNRLEKRTGEVAEDRKALAKKKDELTKSKSFIEAHEAAIAAARNRKKAVDDSVLATALKVEASKRNSVAIAQQRLESCRNNLSLVTEALEDIKKKHRQELAQVELLYSETMAQEKLDETNQLSQIKVRKTALETDLNNKLVQIEKDRIACLHDKGYSTEVLVGIRDRITSLNGRIEEAKGLRSQVGQYLDWLENSWAERPTKDQEFQTADSEATRYKREAADLLKERAEILEQKQKAINDAGKNIDAKLKLQTKAANQIRELSFWPQDAETLNSGRDQLLDIDALVSERRRLTDTLDEHREKIRLGVEEIRRQMSFSVGTGPEKFHATALHDIGYPRSGKEHEWLEIFRNWFDHEHVTNRTSLLQLGKTMAQNISYFWKSLEDFKQGVSTFATDLKSNLEQGRIFESIADVTTDIKAHVDTQNYWEAVGNLHREYEAWHTDGDPTLPPASFVAAAKEVANVVGDDKGLIADPVDLISLKISANVNNQGPKTASNEHELANMSSNGLSYIILCVILIGFVNRIRRNEPVVVPFVVDELKDLSFPNAKTLLDLLTRNNITMISAFPDVDLDLAELFERNYKILPGRKVGLINLDKESEDEKEVAHV